MSSTKLTVKEAVLELRKVMDLDGPMLAAATGADTAAVYRWSSGENDPSPGACISMAAVAANAGLYPLAVSFLEHSGINHEAVALIAVAMLKQGLKGERVDRLVVTIEAILKQRTGKVDALVGDGEIVLVPRYPNGESESHDAPPLPLPGSMISNIASTYYLVADSPGNGFAAGDRLVFDRTAAATRRPALFDGKDILVNFSSRAPQDLRRQGLRGPDFPEPVTWPRGLFVGTLGHRNLGGQGITEIVLAPRDVPRHNWGGQNTVLLDKVTHPKHWHIDSTATLSGKQRQEHQDRVVSEHSDAFADQVLPEDCEILGRFIALFNGRLD